MGDFASGLTQGLAGSVKESIERNNLKEYRDALTKQAKAHADLFESQQILAKQKAGQQQAMQEWFMQEDKAAPGPQSGLTQQPNTMMPANLPVNTMPGIPAGREAYAKMVHDEAVAQGVPPWLAMAVARNESNFNPQATSPKGAQGVMQLMPGTARMMGVQNAYDPQQNVRGGVGYLGQQLQTFGGDIPRAVAAYNTGPGNVQKGIMPKETQQFVGVVLKTANEYQRQQTGQGLQPQQMMAVTQFANNMALRDDPFEGWSVKKRIAFDALMKSTYDFDPQLSQSDIVAKGDPSQGIIFYNKRTQKITGYIEPNQQWVEVDVTGPKGEKGKTFIPKPRPVSPLQGGPFQTPGIPQGNVPGAPQPVYPTAPAPGDVTPQATPSPYLGAIGGNYFQTAPAPSEIMKDIPDTLKTKIANTNKTIDILQMLDKTYKPGYTGLKGTIGSIEDKYSGVARDIGLGNVLPGDPMRKTFQQFMHELTGQKLLERGGSALTKQEIAVIANTLPRLTENEEVFRAGIKAAALLLQVSKLEEMSAHMTTDKDKYVAAQKQLMDEYHKTLKPQIQGYIESQTPGAGSTNIKTPNKPSLSLGKTPPVESLREDKDAKVDGFPGWWRKINGKAVRVE